MKRAEENRTTPTKGYKRDLTYFRYKGISKYHASNGVWYRALIGRNTYKWFRDEKEAALWVDKVLISRNQEPIHILKRVS